MKYGKPNADTVPKLRAKELCFRASEAKKGCGIEWMFFLLEPTTGHSEAEKPEVRRDLHLDVSEGGERGVS